jgi:hypothetical protein
MESFRGPETQVLRLKPSSRLSRSWNPGPESETQCPFIEILKPRSWEWNPVPVYRGLETQVLRVKPSVRLSRSWNPGPESETQCPFIEVLKPRSSEPNTEVLKPNVLRAKCSNAGLQARADCVRPSRVPTSGLIYVFFVKSQAS